MISHLDKVVRELLDRIIALEKRVEALESLQSPDMKPFFQEFEKIVSSSDKSNIKAVNLPGQY